MTSGPTRSPKFALDTLRQGEKVGQPQILFRTSNCDPALDYTISYQGLVSDFFPAGLVSAAVDLHYGGGATPRAPRRPLSRPFPMTPRSRSSTSRMAWTAACAPASPLRRWRARGYAAALWRLLQDGVDRDSAGHDRVTATFPLINGSDTNFSQPYVLTYPGSGYPTDMPRPELYVSNLTGFQGANGFPTGTINSNQLFGADFGVLK